MTDIYRVFEKSTRAITSDEKSYGGQVFDANTTTIHFQILNKGEDWDFRTHPSLMTHGTTAFRP